MLLASASEVRLAAEVLRSALVQISTRSAAIRLDKQSRSDGTMCFIGGYTPKQSRV